MQLQRLLSTTCAGLMISAAPALAQAPTMAVSEAPRLDHQFVVSGHVGSSFGESAEEASLDFGGTFDYLRNGIWGFEFLAGFSPDFQLERQLAGETQINNYMVNGILAAPLGDEGRVQPFVSGGVGYLTLRSDDARFESDDPFDPTFDDAFDSAFEVDDEQFALNVGGGIMAFRDHWGFRGEVRYFNSAEDEGERLGLEPNTPAALSLENVDFWRANIGVAYRW